MELLHYASLIMLQLFSYERLAASKTGFVSSIASSLYSQILSVLDLITALKTPLVALY
jgi:hypothetical protein